MKNIIFIVDESGIRLDKYLTDKLEQYSRSQIQKYIKNGNITVDSTPQAAKYLVHNGEKIYVEISELPELTHIVPQDIPLDIIYEDDAIIVVNKPAGMIVHPGTGNIDGTLANALAYHCEKLSNLNGDVRPGIVHRLDKDTSGVIVAAKTNFAHMKLAEQFANRLVKKVYYGITWGTWKEKVGVIDQPIARKRSDPTTFIVNKIGKESLTKYDVIKETNYFSLVNYFPKTGRTHQIRVHSSFMGNPLIGDKKYGGDLSRSRGYIQEVTKKITSVFQDTKRHILHAQKITFTHPNDGEKVTCEALLPDDINNIITKIELLNV